MVLWMVVCLIAFLLWSVSAKTRNVFPFWLRAARSALCACRIGLVHAPKSYLGMGMRSRVISFGPLHSCRRIPCNVIFWGRDRQMTGSPMAQYLAVAAGQLLLLCMVSPLLLPRALLPAPSISGLLAYFFDPHSDAALQPVHLGVARHEHQCQS